MTFQVVKQQEVNWMTGEKSEVITVKVGAARVRFDHEVEATHFVRELKKLLNGDGAKEQA